MSVIEVEKSGLASDRRAAPSLRVRDWAGDGLLFGSAGMVSDKFRLAPAVAFDHEVGDGQWSVKNLKSAPTLVNESAPDMVRLVAGALEGELVEMAPVFAFGRPMVLAGSEAGLDVSVFEAGERRWAISRDLLADLVFGAEWDGGQAFPTFWGSTHTVVRWQLFGQADSPLKPCVVRRSAYSRSTSAKDYSSSVYEAGRFESLIMPVKVDGMVK